MKILVPLRQVPDLVEDLEVDDSGKALDTEYIKFKLNEFDDHALEEALLVKEASGGEVIALALDGEDAEKLLFTAMAKGADKGVKLTGAGENLDNTALAAVFKGAAESLGYDLLLTGVQSVADRDGQLAPLLATALGAPSIGVVTKVAVSGTTATVEKEYAGGITADFEVDLPAVLGIQAAQQSPRYAPVSKVRQVQQTATLDELAATTGSGSTSAVSAMAPPEKGAGAKMLGGADEILEILKEKGVA